MQTSPLPYQQHSRYMRYSFRRSTGKRGTFTDMPKVIIVGAGAAGIAAASRLLENGINDVIILEAENRIGGRIHSVDFGGSVVDLGGQWCHGEKDNIVYELVKDLDLLSTSHNNYSDFTFYLSDGTVVDKSVTNCLVKIADDVLEDEEAAKEVGGTFGEYFVKEFQKRIAQEFPDNKRLADTADLLIDWFHKLVLCLDSARSWFELSSTGPFQYQKCDGDPYLQWRDKGYRTILYVLMKKIPDVTKQLPFDDKILLNKEVNKIVWDFNTVSNGGVTVECTDGSSYNGDHVIITVSLGVLKNIYQNFSPALPVTKQTAIEAMAIGAIMKILLKFPDQWWPEDLKGFSFIWTEEDKKKLPQDFPEGPCDNGRSWLEDIFGFYVIDSHPRVLLGWVVGPMVEKIEQLTDDLIERGSIFLLKKFVGHKYNVMQPDGLLRSKWKSNPHFNGAYTYPCLRAEAKNVSHADLASPVVNNEGKQVLLFAGEGTHTKYYSTVHGAIETGFREADRILNIYKSPKQIHRKVAIIGAGIAGLGAATTLYESGITDFVILEAQNKPGGRILTLEVDGNIIELGAQWIHGKENPLYDLAKRAGLVSEVITEEGLGIYVRDNGEIVDNDIVKRVDFEIGKILEECEGFVNLLDHPTSVGEFMERKFLEYLCTSDDSDEIKEIKRELFDWHVRFQIIDNSCLNLKRLSAKGWGQYICVEDKAHNNLICGYDRLVSILVDELPEYSLLVNKPVSCVKYASKFKPLNELICQDGSIVTCDHLIITPSLGVLKNSLNISPPLPFEMRNSIDRLGFYGIGKIFLIFEYRWWDFEGVQLLWRRSSCVDNETSWTKHITGFDPILHGSTVLLGWVGGEGVEVMENLSEEEVGVHCMKLLRRFIRDRNIPDPVRVIRTRWLSNPWIRGGYCHITPDCDGSSSGMHQLSQPVFVDGKPRVFLAGEAVHPSHYSTTHGAYESGQQQAEVLVQYLMKNSKL